MISSSTKEKYISFSQENKFSIGVLGLRNFEKNKDMQLFFLQMKYHVNLSFKNRRAASIFSFLQKLEIEVGVGRATSRFSAARPGSLVNFGSSSSSVQWFGSNQNITARQLDKPK